MHHSMITTAFTLPGYRLVRNLGVVRGITVRSRSIVGNFLGGLQSLFGGNISIYTELCEQARAETYLLMCDDARQHGANAIVGMRYDATELMAGLTEVLCYGTAVWVEPEVGASRFQIGTEIGMQKGLWEAIFKPFSGKCHQFLQTLR